MVELAVLNVLFKFYYAYIYCENLFHIQGVFFSKNLHMALLGNLRPVISYLF